MTDLSNLYHLKFDELDSSVVGDSDYLRAVHDGWPESYPHRKLGWLMREEVEDRLYPVVSELGMLKYSKWDADDLESRVRMLGLLDELISDNPGSGNPSSLVFSPIKRAKIRGANLKIVLDWLRQEPYSSVVVMSLVLGRTVPGTRKILNQFVKAGWLVRDEVKWIGSTRDIHLFGVSSKGLYYMLDADDIEPEPLRDFKRGRVVQSTGSHVLNIQLARLYFQRLDNPIGQFRKYQAARDMPNFQAKDKALRWFTYPDFFIHDSHIKDDDSGYGATIAVEIEQHLKGGKRYKELIKAHIINMEKTSLETGLPMYQCVIYMLEDAVARDCFEKLFHKHIGDMFDPKEAELVKEKFIFDTYGDLDKRIRALD